MLTSRNSAARPALILSVTPTLILSLTPALILSLTKDGLAERGRGSVPASSFVKLRMRPWRAPVYICGLSRIAAPGQNAPRASTGQMSTSVSPRTIW